MTLSEVASETETSQLRRAPVRACVFVDWNSQLHAVRKEEEDETAEAARDALRRVGDKVTKLLLSNSAARFRVELRLYCGWTKGFTRSDYYRAVTSLTEAFDLDALFPSARVSVAPEIGFGDRLIDAVSSRQYAGLGIHLPNTLRRQDGGGRQQEKMVDTALAVDLLSWCRTYPTGWAILMSNDDDLVPPAFVAEAWLQPGGGRLLLLREQVRNSDRFLRLEGLAHR